MISSLSFSLNLTPTNNKSSLWFPLINLESNIPLFLSNLTFPAILNISSIETGIQIMSLWSKIAKQYLMVEIILNFSRSYWPELEITLSSHSPLIELNNLITSYNSSSLTLTFLEWRKSLIISSYWVDLFVTVIVSYLFEELYWSL